MKTDGLETLSDNDIVTRRTEVMRELVTNRIQLRTAQLEDTSLVNKKRKSLARLDTELRAREIARNLPKGSLLSRSVARLDDEPETGTEEAAAPAKRSRFGLGFLKDALLGRRSE